MTMPLVFSREEYARRLAAVRAKMRERGAEVVLVDEAEHLALSRSKMRSEDLLAVYLIALI
jgi:hypothetical protein